MARRKEKGVLGMDGPMTEKPAGSFVPALAVGLGFLLVYSACIVRHPGLTLRGNELSHVRLLRAIVIKGNFSLTGGPGDVSRVGDDFFSNKPPGYAFLLSPFYWAYVRATGDETLDGCVSFCKWAGGLFSALSATFLFAFLSTFRLSFASRLFGLLAATFGTIFPAYCCLANSIPLSMFLIVLSLSLFRFSRTAEGRYALLAGALFAGVYAATVDYSNGFVLFPLLAVLYGESLARKRLAAAIVITLAALAPLAWYNSATFGNPFAISYSHYAPPSYVPWNGVAASMRLAHIPTGLSGFLFSAGRGLFVISPATCLGLVAVLLFGKRRNAFGLLAAAMALSGIFFNAAYSLWHGGHSVGYRHILPSAVLLGSLSSFVFAEARRPWRFLCAGLLAFSIFTGVASFYIQRDQDLVMRTWKEEPKDVHAHFYRELLIPLLQNKDGGNLSNWAPGKTRP